MNLILEVLHNLHPVKCPLYRTKKKKVDFVNTEQKIIYGSNFSHQLQFFLLSAHHAQGTVPGAGDTMVKKKKEKKKRWRTIY